jgi:threonine/homoserine/homoserine lactone efflux protein
VDGRRGGLTALAGVVAGGIGHVFFGAAGVGLVLQSFPQVFNALLCAGSAYVAWLGWSLVRGSAVLGRVMIDERHRRSTTFKRGLATSLLNPKAYLFMVAIFPQFLRIEDGSLTLQTCVLGTILSFAQLTIYGVVVVAAVRLRAWLGTHAQAQIYLARTVGVVFIVVAASAAWRSWDLPQ